MPKPHHECSEEWSWRLLAQLLTAWPPCPLRRTRALARIRMVVIVPRSSVDLIYLSLTHYGISSTSLWLGIHTSKLSRLQLHRRAFQRWLIRPYVTNRVSKRVSECSDEACHHEFPRRSIAAALKPSMPLTNDHLANSDLRPPFHPSRSCQQKNSGYDMCNRFHPSRQKRHVAHRPSRMIDRATYPQFVGPTFPPHLEPSSPKCELKTSLKRAASLLLSLAGDMDRAPFC